MKFNINNTYWNSNGKYEHLAKKYLSLIPDKGASDNEYIEYLRCACNIYYHLHANSLELAYSQDRELASSSEREHSLEGAQEHSIKDVPNTGPLFSSLDKWQNSLLNMIKHSQFKNAYLVGLDLQSQLLSIKNSTDKNLEVIYETVEKLIDLIFQALDVVIHTDLDSDSDATSESDSDSESYSSSNSKSGSQPNINLSNLDLVSAPGAETVSLQQNLDLYNFLMLFSNKYFSTNNAGRGNAFKNAAKTIAGLKVPASTLFKPEEPFPKLKYIGEYMYNIILEYYSQN